MDLSPFEAAGALLPGMLPSGLGEVRHYAHKYGIKVWFDAEKATKEHYEAQVVGAKDVPDAKVLAIEVGFHAEHKAAERNEETLARLLESEKAWRKVLGPEPDTGPFLGNQKNWRRVSEVWDHAGLTDDASVEAAERLADYIKVLEPLRLKARKRAPRQSP